MHYIKILATTILAIIFFTISSQVDAGSSSAVVPIGGGKYMLTGRNATIFGSPDGIVAKLMIKANEYCQTNNKSEAILLDMSGESAQYGNNTASASVYFKCGSSIAKAKAVIDGRFFQISETSKVTMQISLPTTEDCLSLSSAGSEKTGSCSNESASDALTVRAILESPNDNELIVVEAINSGLCAGLVSGLESSGGLTVLKPCASK